MIPQPRRLSFQSGKFNLSPENQKNLKIIFFLYTCPCISSGVHSFDTKNIVFSKGLNSKLSFRENTKYNLKGCAWDYPPQGVIGKTKI